jgi:hypothetical protein
MAMREERDMPAPDLPMEKALAVHRSIGPPQTCRLATHVGKVLCVLERSS